jgi:ABC-2 type transport system ATP-binding protein
VPVPTYERNLATFVELLDLGDLLAQPVRQLSLGQRMRGDIVAPTCTRAETGWPAYARGTP